MSRINFFQQLKAFYEQVWHGDKEFTPYHVSLYFFLVNQNNRNEWAKWFKVSFDLGMKGSCIGSKTTYYKALKNLCEWGYIEYTEGANAWKTPSISIIPLCSMGRKVPLMPEVEVHNHTSNCTTTWESTSTSTGNLLVPQVGTNKDSKTNTRPKDLETSNQFLEFWTAYPKKVSKPTAEKAFQKAIKKADLSKILESVKIQKDSDNWKKDGGQFIPNPATWLNGERWNDTIEIEKPKTRMEQLEEIDEQVKRNLGTLGYNQAESSQVLCDPSQVAGFLDFGLGD